LYTRLSNFIVHFQIQEEFLGYSFKSIWRPF